MSLSYVHPNPRMKQSRLPSTFEGAGSMLRNGRFDGGGTTAMVLLRRRGQNINHKINPDTPVMRQPAAGGTVKSRFNDVFGKQH